MLLQLSEGLPLEGRALRRRYFTIATGSVCEVAAAVDAAAALGVARQAEVDAILVITGRVRQMLRGLMK